MDHRFVVWFSCGAPSAVAAKLTVVENPNTHVVYCDTGGEHSDNLRFLRDVSNWIGKEITILRNARYTDHLDVVEKTGYVSGPTGARCTLELKRKLRVEFQLPHDVHVWGYTSDERSRADSFESNFPELDSWFPLIDAELTKADCKALVLRAGIPLPEMYNMGYVNNNCIGCVKGGMGYWNKIRRDFPDVFQRAADICKRLGRSPIKDANGIPIMLHLLDSARGNYESEPVVECGVTCETVTRYMIGNETRKAAYATKRVESDDEGN